MFGVFAAYAYSNRMDKKLDILVQIHYIVVMNLVYTTEGTKSLTF